MTRQKGQEDKVEDRRRESNRGTKRFMPIVPDLPWGTNIWSKLQDTVGLPTWQRNKNGDNAIRIQNNGCTIAINRGTQNNRCTITTNIGTQNSGCTITINRNTKQRVYYYHKQEHKTTGVLLPQTEEHKTTGVLLP